METSFERSLLSKFLVFGGGVFCCVCSARYAQAQSEPIAIKTFAPMFSHERNAEPITRHERARRLNEQGVELVFQGETNEGVAKIKQAFANDPENTTILYNLAGLYLSQNKPEEALGIMEEALRHDPDDVAFLKRMAEAALLSNRLPVASDTFEKLAAVEPHDGEVVLKLGTLYAMQKHWEEAERTLLQAKAMLVGDKRVLKNLANVYVVQGRYRDALPLLTEVGGRERSAENEIALAIAFEGVGNLSQAIAHYRAAQQQGEDGEDLKQHLERLESMHVQSADTQATHEEAGK